MSTHDTCGEGGWGASAPQFDEDANLVSLSKHDLAFIQSMSIVEETLHPCWGAEWCRPSPEFQKSIKIPSLSYNGIKRFVTNQFPDETWEFLRILNDEDKRRTLQSHCRILLMLLDHNRISSYALHFPHLAKYVSNILHRSQTKRELMIPFLCGIHPRLGSSSPVLAWTRLPSFDRNLVRLVLRFVAFASPEMAAAPIKNKKRKRPVK